MTGAWLRDDGPVGEALALTHAHESDETTMTTSSEPEERTPAELQRPYRV